MKHRLTRRGLPLAIRLPHDGHPQLHVHCLLGRYLQWQADSNGRGVSRRDTGLDIPFLRFRVLYHALQ